MVFVTRFIIIFMFIAFSIGVQFGEIKGALGITPFSRYRAMQQYGTQGTQMGPNMMLQY